MKNGIERRLFISATGQNDGKTSCSIGLLKGLKEYATAVGFIKPVGQRFVMVGEEQVDEDAVLMQCIGDMHGAVKYMSPVVVPRYFTRDYLDDPGRFLPGLTRTIHHAYAQIAADKDLIVIEGTGHAGVGSVIDLSNAQVAKMLDAKVIIVTLGGIGSTVDEIALNRCLFEREGVEVIGIIANKVLPHKLEQTEKYLGLALARMGLPLFGVIPYTPRLIWPTVRQVAESLKARVVNGQEHLENVVAEVIIGAMTPHNALTFVRERTLLVVPGDRDDLVLAAASMEVLREDFHLAGLLFTGGILPQPQTLDLLARTNLPALAVDMATYESASRIQKLTVKIQVGDEEKIQLATAMIHDHVNLTRIWEAL